MHINAISSYKESYYSPNFGVNWASSKLDFKKKDFFVRIKGYGRDLKWAKKTKETADAVVNFIREKCNFDEALKKTTEGVTEANQIPIDEEKRNHTGILRIKRDGWRHGSSWSKLGLITRYDTIKRYKTYSDKLDHTVRYPLKNPYKDISLTRPVHDSDYGKFLDHGSAKNVNKALEHVNKLFDEIYLKYIKKEIKKEDLADVNLLIAEIRWILAHATPWERGSDAISNTFIRSIYKAIGIKTYPLKKGISLDLEAYCTELDEYKKNFVNYFEKKPKIIE